MSRYQLRKSVVMVGMMGAGKTAVGTALARYLEVPFLDSDAEIEAAANLTVAEIFEQFDEAFFREKESLVLARLLDGAPSILSTGGGAFLLASNRVLIANKGLAVWLKADRNLLWARVRHKDTRPLLRGDNPRKKLFDLLAAREPAYRKAGLVVTADAHMSVADMADKVLEALLVHPSDCLRKVA
jgi:shikimate kinase